jgi:hypothetical protein
MIHERLIPRETDPERERVGVAAKESVEAGGETPEGGAIERERWQTRRERADGCCKLKSQKIVTLAPTMRK